MEKVSNRRYELHCSAYDLIGDICKTYSMVPDQEDLTTDAKSDYATFYLGNRLIVWPYTVVLSDVPFEFNETPIMSKM
jgi:hypothetical protein